MSDIMLIFISDSDKRYVDTDTASNFTFGLTLVEGQGPFTHAELIGVTAWKCTDDTADPPTFARYTDDILVSLDGGIRITNSYHTYDGGDGHPNVMRGPLLGISKYYGSAPSPPVKIGSVGAGSYDVRIQLRDPFDFTVLTAKAGATPYALGTAENGDIGKVTVHLRLS